MSDPHQNLQARDPLVAGDPLVISCDTCNARFSSACSDCVVTFFCGEGAERGEGALILDFEQERAVRLLAREGLVPHLRHTSTG